MWCNFRILKREAQQLMFYLFGLRSTEDISFQVLH